MASRTGSKRFALFAMATAGGLHALSPGQRSRVQIAAAAFVAAALLMAVSEVQPDVASGLALLIVLSSVLVVPGRAELFGRITGTLTGTTPSRTAAAARAGVSPTMMGPIPGE